MKLLWTILYFIQQKVVEIGGAVLGLLLICIGMCTALLVVGWITLLPFYGVNQPGDATAMTGAFGLTIICMIVYGVRDVTPWIKQNWERAKERANRRTQ